VSGSELYWLVLRTDDNGGTYLVRDGLSEPAAARLVEELTERGHKQTYTAYWYTSGRERSELLKKLLVRL
jgi:hypothetical protein